MVKRKANKTYTEREITSFLFSVFWNIVQERLH